MLTELNFLNKKPKDLLKLTLHLSISKSSQSLKFNTQKRYNIQLEFHNSLLYVCRNLIYEFDYFPFYLSRMESIYLSILISI